MKNTGAELERLADAITLLKRGPHTAAELGKRLEVQAATARRWCEIFEYKGHARLLEKRVRNAPAKAWEWAR